ncbi:hypothetical protein MPSEU_001056700 [Mayamaea pseudoterrestris]|nr:hypothetical protein MPSEU_001056700 [Mayamaea pseudoterrestris]
MRLLLAVVSATALFTLAVTGLEEEQHQESLGSRRSNNDPATFVLPASIHHRRLSTSLEPIDDTETNSNSSAAADDDDTAAFDAAVQAEIRRTDAVLFPCFSIVIGVLVYYTLSRIPFLHQWLPYTAAMFVIGAMLGVGCTLTGNSTKRLNDAVQVWTNIDAEVLMLIFLPGLIYKEIAIGLNVYLFRASIWQSFVFAFPMVLAGASLTAVFVYYVFPYQWSFNLCMIFGSILSATDTVSVAALMNELGASPRLKVHVSGESLLNDGSVIVFYSIFTLRYLYELGIEGVGEEVDFALGVALFFRKSLGGVAVGLAFGIGTIFLISILNHRFNQEENVMEVAAMLGMIYAGYFVADYVCELSGVLATVIQGITIKFLGRAMMNDKRLLDDFWTLIENLLNTVLFTLGGVVWGNILVEQSTTFDALEWGYLILLYVVLTVIRALIFFGAYPITKNIGLGTCWRETVFQIHAGLRGAVGITLALALNAQISHLGATGNLDPIYIDQTRKAFGFVGGIAFMTLIINAPTCKPLLIYLNLSESSETRDKILNSFRTHFRKQAIAEMVELLAQPRFKHVNFSFIEHHISFLADLTKPELMEAVERRKVTTLPSEYTPPHLGKILQHFNDDDGEAAEAPLLFNNSMVSTTGGKFEPIIEGVMSASLTREPSDISSQEMTPEDKEACPNLFECRSLFLDILKSAYDMQVSEGELVQRLFLTVALERSLDLARDQVANGQPLSDWNFVNSIDSSLVKVDRTLKHSRCILSCLERIRPGLREQWKQASFRLNIERAMAFMAAHRYAQDFLKRDAENVDPCLSKAAKIVLQESEEEWLKAEMALNQRNPAFVERSVSHKFCSILLHSSIIYIGTLVGQGLLREQEAEHWVREVEKELDGVNKCHRGHGVRARQCSNMSDMKRTERMRQVSSMSDLLKS